MQNKDWPNLQGLLGNDGPVALLGAPMQKGSVTPCDYHRAPAVFRQTLKRISTYDLQAGIELDGLSIKDAGDVDIAQLSPKDGFAPLVQAFRKLTSDHELSVLIGGHNGITRAGMHSVDAALNDVALITLDAHFDLRPIDSTRPDGGLMNGNPVSALLADGLDGRQISQIGIAPFANSAAMHRDAIAAGIRVYTMSDISDHSLAAIFARELDFHAKAKRQIYIDFDIDVIDRSFSPGAPGGRPGGITTPDFFTAARMAGAHPSVRAVDLCEFDPALDVSDTTALIAARWFGELLCGFTQRPDPRL